MDIRRLQEPSPADRSPQESLEGSDRQFVEDFLHGIPSPSITGNRMRESLLNELASRPHLHKQLARAIIKKGAAWFFFEHLDRFHSLDAEVVRTLIEQKEIYVLMGGISRFDFKGLDDGAFNSLLELTQGDNLSLEKIASTEWFNADEAKQLYVVRMLMLFPRRYKQVAGHLERYALKAHGTFSQYLESVNELEKFSREMLPSEIDPSRLSFNIEIEALNIDKHLEYDSPVTNDRKNFPAFVQKIDEVNQRLRADIEKALAPGNHIARLYDSVHINIGLPPTWKLASGEAYEIRNRLSDLRRLLMLVGLVYNPLDRVRYMFDRRFDSLFTIDENAKFGYTHKMQDRLWSFDFSVRNAGFFGVILGYLDHTLSACNDDFGKGKEKVLADCWKIVRIIEEESRRKEEGDENARTYAELIRSNLEINAVNLLAASSDNVYLPGRQKMLGRIMRVLAAE